MIGKKILIVSTYPIKNPMHGGQKRTYAINEAYKKIFSNAKHCAVYYKPFYAYSDIDDIALGPTSERLVMQSPLSGDIICGEAIYNDVLVKNKMEKLLQDFKPDIIHIEQPFPYLGLKPLLKDLRMNPKIVFGSQNIEAPMKRKILESVNVSETKINDTVKLIVELEKTLSRESDLVVACTNNDLVFHKKLGATNLVLAQNGVTKTTTTPNSIAYWKTKFQDLGVNKIAVFVGSAHPPNWSGFIQMIGKGLGFVPYDSRIVVAGSICDYFEREIKTEALNIEDTTFWLRAYLAGRLSEERLVALIEQADIMILPITEGGGSNLKTAEAILANKKVVATDHALRSFEWFRDFPNVWVANDKITFQECIQHALVVPFVERTAEQTKLAKQVEWRNCLTEMITKVGEL